jgi:hypothetical protein
LSKKSGHWSLLTEYVNHLPLSKSNYFSWAAGWDCAGAAREAAHLPVEGEKSSAKAYEKSPRAQEK